jgi:excisionase family DNA binding protein
MTAPSPRADRNKPNGHRYVTARRRLLPTPEDSESVLPLYRIPEACELLAIRRSKIYELIGRGQIETVKIGSSTRIPADSLHRFVARLRGEDGAN